MRIERFEDVIAWQKARELTVNLRSILASNKDWAYNDQIFRASLSIMNNIAEGFDRGSDKELKHFLHIARGSSSEVRSMLPIATDLKYISNDDRVTLVQLTEEISRLLTGFIKKLD